MPKIRLKGQACLQFWHSLCDNDDKREVPTQRLEEALKIQFPTVEKYALDLILNYVISNGRKLSVTIEEFDQFVRKFLPFEDCLKVAIESLIDPQTKSFFPWFHGFAKSDFFASTTSSQPTFYIRLSTNTQPFHNVIPARCLVEHSISPPDTKIIVQHITRTKHNGKYFFTSSHPTVVFDSLYHYIATRKAQNYVPLPRAVDSHQFGRSLRELAQLPENSRCFNCARVGAQTAACLSYGTFVCGSCAGLHRELGHGVKSLSSAFTSAELDYLAQAGNKVCARLLLEGYDRSGLDIDSADAMRNFMRQVYVERRWVPSSNNLGPGETPPRPVRAMNLEYPISAMPSTAAGIAQSTARPQVGDEGLRNDLIGLSTIPDKWLLVKPLIQQGVSKEMEGPVFALDAALTLLKNLWYLSDPRWQRVRHKVKLGLVKDTKLYGNTSVSMGAATMFLSASSPDRSVGFLNCGTGGIKYQLYSNRGGILHLVSEYKPKGGASPNALQVGSYKPKASVSFETCKDLLLSELKHSSLPWLGQEATVDVYAFVTGTIRQHWEDMKDSNEKKNLELEMEKLFEQTGVQKLPNNSFFLTQTDEGTLELLGSRAMYANLVQANLLDNETEVIGSFGIGKGSCQWMVMSRDGQPDLIAHKAGMSNVSELVKVGQTVLRAYDDIPSKWNKFLDSVEDVTHPVIALKSGCALLLEMKEFPSYKIDLVKPVHRPERTVYISKNGNLLQIKWAGTLDRLCAEATNVFEEGELDTVYRPDGSLVNEDDIKDEETLLIKQAVLPAPTAVAPTTTTATTATPNILSSTTSAVADANNNSNSLVNSSSTPSSSLDSSLLSAQGPASVSFHLSNSQTAHATPDEFLQPTAAFSEYQQLRADNCKRLTQLREQCLVRLGHTSAYSTSFY